MPTLVCRCVQGTKWFDAGIDFISRGVVDHFEFVFGEQSLGARPGGVKYRPLDHFKTEYWFYLDCTQAQYDAVKAAAESQIGKPYDYMGVFGILLFARKTLLRNWYDLGRWYCSELGAWSLQKGDVFQPFPQAVDNVTPQDMLLILSAMTSNWKVIQN